MKKLLIKKFDQFTIEDLYPLPIPDPLPFKLVRGIAFAAYFISQTIVTYYSPNTSRLKETSINLLGKNLTFSIDSYNIAFSIISVTVSLSNLIFHININYDNYENSRIIEDIKVQLPNKTACLFIYLHETEQHKEI